MVDLLWLLCALVAGGLTGLVGRWIARQKGRNDSEGFLLGFSLSVIGLIIEGLLPEIKKPTIRT